MFSIILGFFSVLQFRFTTLHICSLGIITLWHSSVSVYPATKMAGHFQSTVVSQLELSVLWFVWCVEETSGYLHRVTIAHHSQINAARSSANIGSKFPEVLILFCSSNSCALNVCSTDCHCIDNQIGWELFTHHIHTRHARERSTKKGAYRGNAIDSIRILMYFIIEIISLLVLSKRKCYLNEKKEQRRKPLMTYEKKKSNDLKAYKNTHNRIAHVPSERF